MKRIEVAPVPGGYVAYILGNSKYWVAERTIHGVLGALIRTYSEIFGIDIEILGNTEGLSAEEVMKRVRGQLPLPK